MKEASASLIDRLRSVATMSDANLHDVFRAAQAHQRVLQTIPALAEQLIRGTKLLADCMRAGNKLLTCGNGGSTADASHLATEFIVRLQEDRRSLPAI